MNGQTELQMFSRGQFFMHKMLCRTSGSLLPAVSLATFVKPRTLQSAPAARRVCAAFCRQSQQLSGIAWRPALHPSNSRRGTESAARAIAEMAPASTTRGLEVSLACKIRPPSREIHVSFGSPSFMQHAWNPDRFCLDAQALEFDDTLTRELPGDEEVSYKRRQVPRRACSSVILS